MQRLLIARVLVARHYNQDVAIDWQSGQIESTLALNKSCRTTIAAVFGMTSMQNVRHRPPLSSISI